MRKEVEKVLKYLEVMNKNKYVAIIKQELELLDLKVEHIERLESKLGNVAKLLDIILIDLDDIGIYDYRKMHNVMLKEEMK